MSCNSIYNSDFRAGIDVEFGQQKVGLIVGAISLLISETCNSVEVCQWNPANKKP